MLTYKGEVFCELYKRLAACRIDRAEMVWTREKNVRWQNRTSVVTMETKYHPSTWASTETLDGQHQSGGGETRNDIAGGGEFRDVPGQEEFERLRRWQALGLSAQRYSIVTMLLFTRISCMRIRPNYPGVNIRLSKYGLRLSRRDVRILVGLERNCNDFECVRKPTESRLSLTHCTNKSSRWAE